MSKKINIDGRMVAENWLNKEIEKMTDDEVLATLDWYYDLEEEDILDFLDDIIEVIEALDFRFGVKGWRAYLNESQVFDFEYAGKIYLHNQITERELKGIVADIWEELEN